MSEATLREVPIPSSASTPLSRHLAAAKQPRKRPEDAFDLACRKYRAGERIDMQELAAELGISRATLFRWVGNRDQLTAEVLWWHAEAAFTECVRGARGSGIERVVSIFERYAEVLVRSSYLQTYLTREPEAGLRLLTTRAGVVQQRARAAIRQLLADEVASGNIDPHMDLDDLALVIVRVGEAFTYTDLITGEEPDPAKAAVAFRALLA